MKSKVNGEEVRSLNFPGKEPQLDIYLTEVSSQEDNTVCYTLQFYTTL